MHILYRAVKLHSHPHYHSLSPSFQTLPAIESALYHTYSAPAQTKSHAYHGTEPHSLQPVMSTQYTSHARKASKLRNAGGVWLWRHMRSGHKMSTLCQEIPNHQLHHIDRVQEDIRQETIGVWGGRGGCVCVRVPLHVCVFACICTLVYMCMFDWRGDGRREDGKRVKAWEGSGDLCTCTTTKIESTKIYTRIMSVASEPPHPVSPTAWIL